MANLITVNKIKSKTFFVVILAFLVAILFTFSFLKTNIIY